jgi:hypothetical protein
MSGWESYELGATLTATLRTHMEPIEPGSGAFRYIIAVNDDGKYTLWLPPNTKAWEYQESNSTMPESSIVLMDSIHTSVFKPKAGGNNIAAWCGGNPRRWWLSCDAADEAEMKKSFPPTLAPPAADAHPSSSGPEKPFSS